MSNNKRILLCSDLHGCNSEFQELLKTVQYNANTDRLIIVGDIINRGPFSIPCLRYIRENNIEALLGNHEHHFLRWYKGFQDKHWLKSRPHYAQFSDEDITFINNLPLYISIPEHNLWVVHAGVKPNLPLEKQRKEDLLYLRYTDDERNVIPIKDVANKTSKVKPRFWTEFGPFPANVVYGHCVFVDGPRVDKFENGIWTAGIDGGCVFGHHLNCLILYNDGKQEVASVKAKQAYHKGSFFVSK